MEDIGSRLDMAGILRRYGAQKQCIDRCMEWLDEEQQLLLEKLYIVPKEGNVDALCGELQVEKSTVYRRGKKALRRFAAIYAATAPLQ